MKSLKLTSDGDLSFTNADKMKPYVIKGESYQSHTPSLDNPAPIIGVTTNFYCDYKNGRDRVVLHSLKGEDGREWTDTLEIDPIKRKVKLTHNIGVSRLYSSAALIRMSDTSKVIAHCGIPYDNRFGYPEGRILPDISNPIMCNGFPTKAGTEYIYTVNSGISIATRVTILIERIPQSIIDELSSTSWTASNEFNAWFKEKDLYCIYPLDTPQVFELEYTDHYDHQLEMIEGAELTRQKIKTVLGTHKGEWFFNEDEGIDYDNILGKKQWSDNANDSAEVIDTELNDILKKRLDGER